MKYSMLGLVAGAMLTATSAWAEVIPGQVVVDEMDDISVSEHQAIMAGIQSKFPEAVISATDLVEDTQMYVVEVVPSQTEELMDYVGTFKNIQHVEPVHIVTAYWEPNDPLYKDQWGMKAVNAEKAWNYTQGQGVTVAVIDTGVACEDFGRHSQLSDLKNTKCSGGWNFVEDNDHPTDGNLHGSHVAGTIAQSTNNAVGAAGLSYAVSIMPVKVLSDSGSGTDVDVANGIRWAADHGAQVANLSLGSDSRSSVIQDATEYAYQKGMVVVAAAGNSGRSVGYPAGYDHVIAVSAIDSNGAIAKFSSRGPQVDIAAPGVNILQQTVCDGGRNGCEEYKSLNGTSMASPHVAAAAALVVSLGVTDPDKVESILKGHANTNDTTSHNPNEYGAGLLNAGSAASSTAWTQGLTRMALLVLWCWGLVTAMRKQEHLPVKSWAFLTASFFLSVGLFFLPSFVPAVGTWFYATRPLLDLQSFFGKTLHTWLPAATALVPFGLTALSYHKAVLRQLTAGVASGVGVYLLSLLWSGSHWNPMGFWFNMWMVFNVVCCGLIAKINLERVKDEPVI